VFDEAISTIIEKPVGNKSKADSQNQREYEKAIKLNPKPTDEYATQVPSRLLKN